MDYASLNDFLDIAIRVLTVVGAPLAIFAHFRERAKDRKSRDRETYLRSSDRFSNFLLQLLQLQEIDAYAPTIGRQLSAKEYKREIVFEVITQMFEDSFLSYRASTDKLKHNQWRGWDSYIRLYCSFESYRDWWTQRCDANPTFEKGSSYYDIDFETYIFDILESGKSIDAGDNIKASNPQRA